MKRGATERPGRRVGWVMVNKGGYLFGDMRSTRKELIEEFTKDWPGGISWRRFKRQYGVRIVWAEMKVLSL